MFLVSDVQQHADGCCNSSNWIMKNIYRRQRIKRNNYYKARLKT